jgi:hypothetical protein
MATSNGPVNVPAIGGVSASRHLLSPFDKSAVRRELSPREIRNLQLEDFEQSDQTNRRGQIPNGESESSPLKPSIF